MTALDACAEAAGTYAVQAEEFGRAAHPAAGGNGLDRLPATAAPFDPVYGTWLDDCLCLRGEAGKKFLQDVLECLEKFERELGKKPRRQDHRANFTLLVDCMLANALRASFFRESDAVAYSRKDSFYVGRHPWLSGGALARTVDLLDGAGLLRDSRGEHGQTSSTYSHSAKLMEISKRAAIRPEHIGRTAPPLQSLIILRAARPEGAKRKGTPTPQLRFQPTKETLSWAEQLDSFNRFVERHEITLNLSDAEKLSFVAAENEKRSAWNREPKIVEPEFFRRHLYRIFNDGTFDHGGRLYRAWWLSAPQELRKKITINGSAVVELDYSGFVARSIYHQNGEQYRDDPYELNELSAYAEQLGQPRHHFRPSIKKLLIALLNGEDGSHPERVRLEASFLPRFTRVEVEGMIAAKHPLLAGLFRTAEGKRNQRLDSDLALEIITNLMNQGILALPVHDSFVVEDRFRADLDREMNETYHRKLGYYPIVGGKD